MTETESQKATKRIVLALKYAANNNLNVNHPEVLEDAISQLKYLQEDNDVLRSASQDMAEYLDNLTT